MRSSLFFVCGIVSFCLAACGSTDSGSSSGTASLINVAVTGSSATLSVPSTETLPTFSDMDIRLYDANTIWSDPVGGSDPNATPLLSEAIASLQSSCSGAGCTWQLSKLNIASTDAGLVALLVGNTNASRALWAPVYTNIVNADYMAYSQKHHSKLSSNAPAYAMSQQAVTKIGKLLSIDPNELIARGLVVGIVVGKDPTNNSGGLPSAVSGAVVTLTSDQNATMQLYYPNATYSGENTAKSTNSDGIFWLYGRQTGTAPITTTLAIAASGQSLSWDDRPVTLMPNSIVVTPLSAVP